MNNLSFQANCDYSFAAEPPVRCGEVIQNIHAASVHSSRSTVHDVISLASQLEISWPLDPEVTDAVLETLLYPERAEKQTDRILMVYLKIHRELAKKGVTLSLLWTEYCMEAHNAGKVPYMSTQFGDRYRKWARVSKATMRIQRKPGDTFEVGWL